MLSRFFMIARASLAQLSLISARNRAPMAVDPAIVKILEEVSLANLREFVRLLAFPRHYFAENQANRCARDLLLKLVTSFGYDPSLQGDFDNIVMTYPGSSKAPLLLLGAHYDSVPGTPGADDNASAVAVCLECARLITHHKIGPVMIVLFNREEDGCVGSSEFVAHLADQYGGSVREAHIFEMVGYRDRTPGSQKMPQALPPLAVPKIGDFLALVANKGSNAIADDLVSMAASYTPGFPVHALKVYFGLENIFRDLSRSDHAPFWNAGIPAIMWTDTSEFRNPHYHLATDTPETLDYDFMVEVTKLALTRAISHHSAHR